jgi:hypothetical protein
MSFKTASAALAALFVVASATSATAGVVVPSLTATASPISKTASETVNLTVTASSAVCTGDSFQFFDKTSSPEKLVCGASISGVSGTCPSNVVNEPGARTLEARFLGGVCTGQTATVVVHVQEPIPTTSEWTMWGLMGALLLGGGVVLSRRFKTAA